MEHFSVEIKDVETELRMLVSRFPSTSQVALVHDAEDQLRVALKMWRSGDRSDAVALVVTACVCLYNAADALSQ